MDFVEWELVSSLTLTILTMLLLAFGFPMGQSYVRMNERLFGSMNKWLFGDGPRAGSADLEGGLGVFVGVTLFVVALVFLLGSPRPTDTSMILLGAIYGATVALLSPLLFAFRRGLADWATRRTASGRPSQPFWRAYHVVLYTVLAWVGVLIGAFVLLRSLGVV